MFEHYEVISRSVGDTTDIVTKEMYDFYDKGDRHITLRPEGTAPVVRSYVENKLFAPEIQKPVKLYYMGSMFRYERPQAGRLREFHQIGVECFGSANPATDVETIAMADHFLKELGIHNVTLHLNTLGSSASRSAYRTALIDYLTPLKDKLSADSQRRLEENPLRVLDSKEKEDKEAVENAPSILDYLDEESQAHFDAVCQMLDSLDIAYVIDTNTFKVLQEIQTHADVEGVDVLPSDIAIDVSEQEIYVSAQGSYDRQSGESKGNSGVTVYDLKTGEYKKSIPFGKQALSLVNDENRDLVYVTDFATGKVGVIDGRADRLIGEVQSASKGANDITLGADGEVYIANKDGFAPDTTIPFGMDYAQGTLTSKEETADSITKVKVTPENMTAENPEVEINQITPQQETFAGYPAPLTGGDNRTLTNVSYNDIAGNLFENDIIKLGEKSITTGYPDGGFHPLESIERGAMAAYLYRLAGSPEFEAPAESPFSDVPTTHPFYKEIAWLKATGITTGWEDGTFRPEDSINREAMAAFFYRAAGSPEVQQKATFTDVSGNPFAKEISWFQFSKLSTGWPDSTFRPHDSVKRDAMAAYMMRYMGNFDSVKVSVPAPAK